MDGESTNTITAFCDGLLLAPTGLLSDVDLGPITLTRSGNGPLFFLSLAY